MLQACQEGLLLDGLAATLKGLGVGFVAGVDGLDECIHFLLVPTIGGLAEHLHTVVLPIVEVVVNHIHNGHEHVGILTQNTGGLNSIPQPAILAGKLGFVVILSLNLGECGGANATKAQDSLGVVLLEGVVNLLETLVHNHICAATVCNPVALREDGDVLHILGNVGNLVKVGLVDVVELLGHRNVAILDVVDG